MDDEDDVDVEMDDEDWGTDAETGVTPLLSESGGRGRARGRGRRKWFGTIRRRRGDVES
jgi:hypothetical protein